jgi:thiol-disulfide isomerase/thioredoxin
MDAVTLGPVMLPLPRLFALIAFVALFVTAAVLGRRVHGELGALGTPLLISGGIAARLGYVLAHAGAYGEEPWTVLFFWQGGFDPLWGVAGAVFYGLWHFRGRRRLQRLAQVPVAVALAVWLGLSGVHAWQAEPLSATLPDRSLTRLNGGSAVLSELEGRPVVVNLWASWCPPCRREMPRLAEEAERHPGVRFAFVNQGEDREAVTDYLARQSFALEPVFLDPRGRLRDDFRAPGLPATLFFNAEGRLVDAHVGELSRAALREYLRPLLD